MDQYTLNYCLTTMVIVSSRKTVNAGICLPISFIHQMDMVRGDICRSRFVLRAVEKYLKDKGLEVKE